MHIVWEITEIPEKDIEKDVITNDKKLLKLHNSDKKVQAFPISKKEIISAHSISERIIFLTNPHTIAKVVINPHMLMHTSVDCFTDTVKEYFCPKINFLLLDCFLFIPIILPVKNADASIIK